MPKVSSVGFVCVVVFVLVSSLFFSCLWYSDASAQASTGNVQASVILHYDTYYPSVNLAQMHQTLEKALSELRDSGFPMSKVLVVTWRNTFENVEECTWFLETLNRYGVSSGSAQLGLYVAPSEAHSVSILRYAMEENFYSVLGRYPYFVAGFSASSETYYQLAAFGVKVSFFNLWEEGEDFSYRGFSTGDNLFGANWEGSPFQPYKPSVRSANVPGLTADDELDIWEAHWLTRNPSYAFFAVNSRNMGSIHPFDLLQGDVRSSRNCSSSEAVAKFNVLLDLVDYNAQYNPLMTVSYPVEVSYLAGSDVFSVWQSSIREFIQRQYRFVDAVELRNNLENLSAAFPHTPVCFWYDNMTDSDVVVRGEHTPFAMVSSVYGRFIYARRDPVRDSGAPLVSVVSYTTARGYNSSFQSVRELVGCDDFKMNTFVNDVPVEMRWTGDVQNVSIISGKAIVIHWRYLKSELTYADFEVVTYLTPYGVLMEKELVFKDTVAAKVSVVQYATVQANSPTALTDGDVLIETDKGSVVGFSSSNEEVVDLPFIFNNTLLCTADDGYALGVTVTSGSPDVVYAIDESGESPFEVLEFAYFTRQHLNGDVLHLSYALTPATDIQNARDLAQSITEIAQELDLQQTSQPTSWFILPIAGLCAIAVVGVVLFKFRRRFSRVKNVPVFLCSGLPICYGLF